MPTNTWGMCTRTGTFLLRVHQYVACVPVMPRLRRRKLGQYEGVYPHLGYVGLLRTKSIHLRSCDAFSKYCQILWQHNLAASAPGMRAPGFRRVLNFHINEVMGGPVSALC